MIINLLQADLMEAIPTQQEMTYSFFELATKGGWLMLILLLLSFLAIYIFGSKLFSISKAGKIDKDFMMDIRDYIHDGKIKSAKTLCSKYDTPVARMVEAGLTRCDKPLQDVQIAVENVGNVEIAKLEKGLPYLATIAGGAPMIGFLGTVMGMIQAFFNMANAGNNIDITLLSNGIYTAMVTTVGGLIVGILAYFGYNYLSARISSLVYSMESATIKLMDALSENNEPKAE